MGDNLTYVHSHYTNHFVHYPLSPFLFIVAMEANHVMMTRAISSGVSVGVKLPSDGPYLSHMLFADDSIFIGDWTKVNVRNLKRILRCFYLVSGLKVNPKKSQLLSVGKETKEVTHMASIFNCKAGNFPFTHL
ncbi:putative RNA-directed DNA polymerase [Helianthus annuus]|nr:putative RNA-directed DNA polymerase [Helianthus annuus]